MERKYIKNGNTHTHTHTHTHIWTRRNNILKISILPKGVWRLNAMPIKVPITFFIEEKQINNPNLYGTTKVPK